MGRRKKEFYAVINGRTSPAICKSWAIACVLVDGYKGNKYEGFKTLENAKAYMQENDISNYDMVGELGQFDLAVKMRDRRYYAVANGLETGIYESYWNEAKPKVDKFSHTCYKRFDTLEKAEEFIAEYKRARQYVDQPAHSEEDPLESMMSQLNLN